MSPPLNTSTTPGTYSVSTVAGGLGAKSASGPVRVLVVDDDFMVADVHRRLVEREVGFVVVGVAHSGADALQLLESLKPDLVLLDIYLPDISGIDVLKHYRSSVDPSNADFLVVSAARDYPTIRSALQFGSFHFLIKPFTAEALTERLARYLAFRRHFGSSHFADQNDIDTGVQVLRASNTRLPKGLSAVTMNLVLRSLAGDGEYSASDVALACGVSRVSARRYLEYLAEVGDVELRLRYATAGRPEHLYRSRL